MNLKRSILYSSLFGCAIFFATMLFSKRSLQNTPCQDCKEMKAGFPAEIKKGNIASIKTYKFKRYEHYLSTFAKDHEMWKKHQGADENKIVNSDAEAMLISEVEYNKDGKPALEIYYDENGNWKKKIRNQFNEEGQAILITTSTPKEKSILPNRVINSGDENIKIDRVKKFTADGLPLITTQQINGGDIVEIFFEYNEEGKIKKSTKKRKKSTGTTHYSYEYDVHNNLIKTTTLDSNMVNHPVTRNMKRDHIYIYNENGCLIESRKQNKILKGYSDHFKYEYNSNGCLSKVTELFNQEPTHSFYFDESMENTQIVKYKSSSMQKYFPLTVKHKYKYDDVGNWITLEQTPFYTNLERPLKDKVVLSREIVYY